MPYDVESVAGNPVIATKAKFKPIIYALVCSHSGIPEIQMMSINRDDVVKEMRDQASCASVRKDWDGMCDNKTIHFSEATDYFHYHKDEWRIDAWHLEPFSINDILHTQVHTRSLDEIADSIREKVKGWIEACDEEELEALDAYLDGMEEER